ncbi:Translation initiation factor eIF-2B subunit epsilon [Chionoecetes opilio]|uniref:Translation initiation factor eIF2B subunit epsilon n=1 Tax=Chionoecetes opilio TaxID=41210 RepID=A0A8J5D4J0_CHIOP|nr:Translation initiation factor eIF-2B subunit epsilon [Chionoecetes opilio]
MAPPTDLHEEQKLQAVIIASCDQDFGAPITEDVPKVLVPLVNTPLLDYSLEWLERCGVDEAIVYCRADHHLNTLKAHCRAFTKRRGNQGCQGGEGGLRVMVVASDDCHSLGDAMRDLYAKSLLTGDFILLSGDSVVTLDLPSLVVQHRESRAADKSAIMTCVYMGEGAIAKGVKSGSAKDVKSGSGSGGGGAKTTTTTATLLVSAATGKRNHLLGGRAVAILDNFDYTSLDTLIRGVIEQEELLGYTIRCKVLEEGYAGRAASVDALLRVSGEVSRRRAHPLVPEISLSSHRVRYSHDACTATYWDPSAKFPKGPQVTGSVVGAACVVGGSTRLRDSVLGDHCCVGEDVEVVGSVLMQEVCIKAGCVLEDCLVGDRVVLGERVRVTAGCVLGKGVVLGPDVTLPPGTRLSAKPPAGDFGSDVEMEFRQEVQDSLNTALREESAPENIILEINSSRHAYNITMEDVLTTVVQGVLRAGQSRGDVMEGMWFRVKAALAAFQDVLRNYVKKGRDQIQVLNAIEALAQTSPPFLPLTKGILYELNQKYEILEDDVICHWYRGGGGRGGGVPLPQDCDSSLTNYP